MNESDVVLNANAGSLKSIELVDFVSAVKGVMLRQSNTSNQSWPTIINYNPLAKLMEISENHFTVSTEKSGGNQLSAQEELTKAAGFEKYGNYSD